MVMIIAGVGIWYLNYSIGGMSVPYASMPRFLESIGACQDGVCDVSSANGCFLCGHVQQLFVIIGTATGVLWDAIVRHTWILMVFGLIIFMFWRAYQIIMESMKQSAKLTDLGERALKFEGWFKDVKPLAIRILMVGALLGVVGMGGRHALQATSDVVVYPVMYVGTSLAMAATGTGFVDNCVAMPFDVDNPMAIVNSSFMCIIGNLNVAILYGASSGFAMMNMAWMGMGGGILTWIGGLLLVLIFLYVGFGVLWKVLNVVFNLVFIIVFLPLLLAAFAFEGKWKLASGVSKSAIDILAKTSVSVIGITLQVMILSSLLSYAMMSLNAVLRDIWLLFFYWLLVFSAIKPRRLTLCHW